MILTYIFLMYAFLKLYTSEMSASDNGFKFHEVTLNGVILAIKHFKSQATGSDGIPQNIIC